MSKPNSRNWNDVQIAIATTAIVTTLGLWNLFSAPPAKTVTAQVDNPVNPPPTEPPVADEPFIMPQVKIMFTPAAPLNPIVQVQKVKKKKSGGGGTVTTTNSS